VPEITIKKRGMLTKKKQNGNECWDTQVNALGQGMVTNKNPSLIDFQYSQSTSTR
jgi:hypothetical protein